MITFVARGSTLLPSLTATTQAIPSMIRPIIPGVVDAAQKTLNQPPPETITSNSLTSFLSQGCRLNTVASNGLSSGAQIRLAHTDVQVPDFSFYRRDSVKDNAQSSQGSSSSRKAFTYMMVAGGTIPTAYAAKTVVSQFVSTWSASADVLALAKIEVKLSDIPEGKNATFKWRGKPLFIRHRTEAEIEKERSVNVAELRDQQADEERVQKPEWLILLGVCTHLGCVPIANSGEYGGYYCPCHGSHYDASGRIRKGPAPLNLEIPTYEFPDEDTVIVG